MFPEINGVRAPFIPIVPDSPESRHIGGARPAEGPSFKDIFASELSRVKFSAHAQSRMASRDILLSENDVARLQSAVERAGQKNLNDSLVMLDDKAFIVNIPNKTVITMLSRDKMEDNIITNIDSAVFA